MVRYILQKKTTLFVTLLSTINTSSIKIKSFCSNFRKHSVGVGKKITNGYKVTLCGNTELGKHGQKAPHLSIIT